jgi:hypothetical protein
MTKNALVAPSNLKIGMVAILSTVLLLGGPVALAVCNANVAQTRPDNR